jgi:Flp pilus assembly protein TadG
MAMWGRTMANKRTTASVSKRLRRFGSDARAVAGIEFGITGLLLVGGLLNAVDVGYYAYRRMEVENAAEMGAQAAWKTCTDPQNPMVPATQNCPALNNAITTAIQSTTLANNVSLASGYPTEGYYCVNASNALQFVGSVSSPPANCAAAGNAGASPVDYLQVGVTYPYQSLFPGAISVMSVSGVSSITKTSWMRMG